MAITLSHGGPTIYRSAARSRQVLVGTIEGVVCMERDPGGPGWHVASRALTDKHIHALLIEPESGTVFAGVNHGSIFASADDGRTWEPRDEGLTEHNVYSLACTRLPGGPRILAGTEPAHLFHSDDLGRHWAEVPALRSGDTSHWRFPAPPHVAHTKHIAVHPDDPQTLFVGIEQGGLLKSTDAGRTFQVIPGMDEDVQAKVFAAFFSTRKDVGAADGSAAPDRRLSGPPGAPSEAAPAHVRGLCREGTGELVSRPLRRLPHLQERRRRADLAGGTPRVPRSPIADGLRGDVPGGLGRILLALRRHGHRRGVVQRRRWRALE